MAAVAWLLVGAGVVLIYAGITGQSIVTQLQSILSGGKNTPAKAGAK